MNTFRNFTHTIFKFKTSSILNILGLAAAFTAFMIIIIQIKFENSFDDCHSKANRIYRVDKSDEANNNFSIIHSRAFIDVLAQSSPHVQATTLINPYLANQRFFFTVNTQNGEKGFREPFVTCFSDITKIFDFQMIEGDPNCLINPECVMIPESIAQKMFGKESAIGKQMNLPNSLWTKPKVNSFTIGGVYKDFPSNTQLNNYIYTAIGENYAVNDFQSQNYICYVLLEEGTDPESVSNNFNKNFDSSLVSISNWKIKLTPLNKIYYHGGSSDGDVVKSGNPETPKILISIAILIIAIAIINYTNFNMALTPTRIRSINIRKVLGSSDSSLRIQLINEGIILSLISFCISLILLYIFSKTNAISFITTDLSPSSNIGTISITFAIAFITGILAAIRPAYYITSFPPALVLKGNFGLTNSGQKVRTVLVGFQFFISITLITVSSFIYLQNKYLQNFSLGYNTDQIAIIELNKEIAITNKESYIAKLKANPNIADVTFSYEKFGAKDSYRSWGVNYKKENIGAHSIGVAWNFFETIGIKLSEGRFPNESDQGKVFFLINKSFQRRYNIQLGEYMDVPWMEEYGHGQIIGITEDVQIQSLRNGIEDILFAINDYDSQLFSYVKIKAGANIPETVEYIEKSIAEINPQFPVQVEFYDSIFNNLYKKEKNTEHVIALFSLLAIIISIAGVFGLVMFECKNKQKEISIRKTLGSTISQVILLFNKTYIRIFIISFILSVPLSYYIVSQWLNNFAYKTPIFWWMFPLAGFIILGLIVLTISFQSSKAAKMNPVQTLKND